jgi:hypothetical protein
MSQASGSRPVNGSRGEHSALAGIRRWLRKLFRRGNGDSQLRDTIEEIIGEIEEAAPEEEAATPRPRPRSAATNGCCSATSSRYGT